MVRRTAEEIRAEIDRYDELLRIDLDFRKALYPEEAHFLEQEETLPEPEKWIATLLQHGSTLSQVLESYKQSCNEILVVFTGRDPDVMNYANGLREFYYQRTGRSILFDFPLPTRKLKTIAKRGKIRNETEFYLVKEYVELNQDAPETAELVRQLREFLHVFEFGE